MRRACFSSVSRKKTTIGNEMSGMRYKHTVDLSIVLLNYNKLELTRKAVNNIIKDVEGVDFELIIVDNNSTDGTGCYIKALRDSRVKLVLNSENLFFGGGNNSGLEACKGKYVLFTQNDMIFEPYSLRNMIDLFKALPNAGCVGIGGGYINRSGIITEISQWWQNPLRQFEYIPVDFVSGCCMLFERNFLKENGVFFDTNFQFFWEDVDICHQVTKAERINYMLHNGMIGTRHLRSATITPLLGVEEREMIRLASRNYYQKKWKEFYQQPDNIVKGIDYGYLFSNLRLATKENHSVYSCRDNPKEITEHRDDAREIASFEFLEFHGEYKKAAEGYREVIQKNPGNLLAYRNLCRVISESGDLDEQRNIVTEFRTCLNRKLPVVIRRKLLMYIQTAILNVARNYADNANYKEAYRYYDELHNIAQTVPTISLCQIEKAKMKCMMENYPEAEQEMKEWLGKNEFLDLEPMMYAAANFYLGEISYMRNDIEVARDRYLMTLTIDPGHERAKKRLSGLNKVEVRLNKV